ncbi:MAG: glycogen debranching protein [Actinomycetota bacterium]|nr:glycogen debranching protein [Actinomycetota bacterium]
MKTHRISFRHVVALVCALGLGLGAMAPAVGDPPGGPTRSTADSLHDKRYVAAGRRAYVIGAENGRFPPMGWHIRGEMGGVWPHPIKALDAYWFAVNGQWVPGAKRFTSGPGYVRMNFPATEGVRLTRLEFSPDGSPVVLVRLTLRNTMRRDRRVTLTMDARSDILASYPWAWTTPSAREFNQQDVGSYDPATGTLTFRESGKSWFAKVRASKEPTFGAIGDAYWGPVPPGERPEYYEYDGDPATPPVDKGENAEVRWRFRLGAGRARTMWLAVAGSQMSEAAASAAARKGLSRPHESLHRMVRSRRRLLQRTKVELPNRTLEAGFDWGKLNMADLTRTVRNVRVRDVEEGRTYPPPVARFRKLTGIGAGYPDYPWYFGTDGAYTAYPLVASGQWGTAMDHLRSIKKVSRALNRAEGRPDAGKVIHEVMTEGSVYFGDIDDPGNTNETAQFASAVYLVWKWTGNDRFLNQMYPFVRDGMRYITTPGCPVDASGEGTCDNDGDGWPEGRGMVERAGMGAEKLDVTVYTWEALRALARMARAEGDVGTATYARTKARSMKRRFEEAWWMPRANLYADSRCNPGDVSADPGNVCRRPEQKLQQRHWINATPMETTMADKSKGRRALNRLETSTFTGACGLYHTGKGGGPERNGELKCWTLPNSVMAIGESNYGHPEDALYYMKRGIAAWLDLEQPGALPEIAPSPEFDPFVDFRERAMFMQAWSSYGLHWPVIHDFLGIRPDVPARKLAVIPDVPGSWPGLSVRHLRVGREAVAASASAQGDRYVTRVSDIADWRLTIGHTVPAGERIESVRLDGHRTEYKVVRTKRGREVRVRTSTSSPHTLVVRTR